MSGGLIDLANPLHSGKVRDSYELGDEALMVVASDRVSVFDVVLPTEIPGKGRNLTEVSAFWLRQFFTDVPNHLISTDVPEEAPADADLEGRTSVVERLEMLPIECIVRGYLYGSVMGEYQREGTATGIKLPSGLLLASKLPEPIFTPSTKAIEGHDENIDYRQASEIVPPALLDRARDLSLELYTKASEFALSRGIIIADTKFEFGLDGYGELMVGDEVLTPDSSRFWDAETWTPGVEPTSFDKQIIRNYCAGLGWDKTYPGPELPDEVVAHAIDRYEQVRAILTQN